MIFSLTAAVAFAAVAFMMAAKDRTTLSHRMAWIPGAMAAMELAMAGALLMGEYPVLTLILMVCRFTVFGCCTLAMKRDAAAARNRRRRRAVWRRITADMQREVQSHAVSFSRCA